MKFYIAKPEGADFPASTRRLHTQIGVREYTVADVYHIFSQGKPAPYVNNRGTGQVADATVKRVRDHFHALSLGVLTTTPDRMVDGHGRLVGIGQRWGLGKMMAADWNAMWPIHLIPDSEFDAAYAGLNAHKGHTAANKITNPDLVWGYVLKHLLQPLVTNKAWGLLKDKHLVCITHNIYARMNLRAPDCNDPVVIYAQRRYTAPMLSVPVTKMEFDVPQDVLEATATGIEFYSDFIDALEEDCKGLKGVLAKAKLAPFCGLILTDQYASKEFKKADTLARRFVRESALMAQLVPMITNGSTNQQFATVSKIMTRLARN